VAKVTELKKNQIGRFRFGSHEVWVSRTGYTGEDGFEVVAPASVIEAVWEQILGAGREHGLKPAGLGARDTLRTEVCYPLYGHELDEETTPIEAGVGFFVALDKGEFVGRQVLAEQKAKGTNKKLAAFKMAGKSAPPRPHYTIWSVGANAKKLGEVVTGTQSPTLSAGIGLGYVPPEFSKPQTQLEIEIRGNRAAAVVVPKPFYKKPG
jgi:aminomethyltransferase